VKEWTDGYMEGLLVT